MPLNDGYHRCYFSFSDFVAIPQWSTQSVGLVRCVYVNMNSTFLSRPSAKHWETQNDPRLERPCCWSLIHITFLSRLQGKAITALVYLSVPVANLSFMLAYEVVSALSQQFTQEHSNYNTQSQDSSLTTRLKSSFSSCSSKSLSFETSSGQLLSLLLQDSSQVSQPQSCSSVIKLDSWFWFVSIHLN